MKVTVAFIYSSVKRIFLGNRCYKDGERHVITSVWDINVRFYNEYKLNTFTHIVFREEQP